MNFQRPMPVNADAEAALLGCVLLDPDFAIPEALSTLQDGAAEIFSERNRELFRLAVDMRERGMAMDGVVIKDEAIRLGVFEKIGGFSYFSEVIGATPNTLRAPEYAELVHSAYVRRRVIQEAWAAANAAFGGKELARDISNSAATAMSTVAESAVKAEPRTIVEMVDEFMVELANPGQIVGLESGYLDLDEITTGFRAGDFVVIAGRPGMGKTALLMNIASNIVLRGQPVLAFSLEMSARQLMERVISAEGRVPGMAIKRRQLSEDQMRQVERTVGTFETMGGQFLIEDDASLSVEDLAAVAAAARRKFGVVAVIVDYLQLLHSGERRRGDNRQVEVSTISRKLKVLAKKLGIPVVVGAQLNREPAATVVPGSTKSRRPRLTDLRESGAIEQDADTVLFIHREAYYAESDPNWTGDRREAEVIIAKQRSGPTGKIRLRWERTYTRFEAAAVEPPLLTQGEENE